jgi:hypothetical protein
LRGGRSMPSANRAAVADRVSRMGWLVRGEPRIAEIEINPLRVYAKGTPALDVLMHVG